MMTTVDSSSKLVDLIKSESERFIEYVKTLSPKQLDHPSPCERWNVGEVIAHLIWFAENYGGMIEQGLRGDQSAPDGFPEAPGTLAGPAIMELYGTSAIELRRDLGDRLVPEFCDRYDWLNDLLKGIGPDGWDKPCYHTLKIRPVASFIPVIVAELAVHEWDIRSTIERAPSVSDRSVRAVMAKLPSNRVPWTLPYEPQNAASGPKCFRFEFADFDENQDILVEDGEARMEPSGEGSADVTISGNAGTFVLLVYGRLTVDSAMEKGFFTAEGDLGLIPGFDRWLSGR